MRGALESPADRGPHAQVESAPAVIKKGLKKEEAEALLAKLKENGGTASLH
jgi:ribosomal protein L7/L12